MLCDITLRTQRNPMGAMVANVNNNIENVVRLQKGIYQCGHWQFDSEIMDEVSSLYPDGGDIDLFPPTKREWDLQRDIFPFGVCDSPTQLLEAYDFEKDPRKFVISLVLIERKKQSHEGGWRWHKWGFYIGDQNPTHEHLFDDIHIDQVYTYHIYELV